MRRVFATLVLLTAALPAFAYTIYFKDGSTLTARDEYTVEGDQALFTLENGTRSAVPFADIDVERTRRLNEGALSGAMVLHDGAVVELETPPPPPQRPTLGSMISSGRAVASAARPEEAETSTGTPTVSTRRARLDNENLANEVFTAFRERGVSTVELRAGDRAGHAWVEIVAETEATVFQGLEAAAAVLHQLPESLPLDGIELHFRTSEHEEAGDFVLDRELASTLANGEVETSTFYIRNVIF